MGGSASGSTGVSSSRNQNAQQSGADFPAALFGRFSEMFGRPITLDDIAGILPRSQSLFGGGGTGIYANPRAYGPGSYWVPGGNGITDYQSPPPAPPSGIAASMGGGTSYTPKSGGSGYTEGGPPGVIGVGGPPTPNPAAPGPYYERPQTPSGKHYTFADVQPYLQGGGRPDSQTAELAEGFKRRGYDPTNFTIEQLRDVVEHSSDHHGNRLYGFASTALGALELLDRAGPGGPPRYVSPDQTSGLGGAFGGGINGALQRLGFGDAAPNYQAPTIAAPSIDYARGGFDRLENSLYDSQFNPVSRQISRDQATADKQLNARLAASGLASSGTGAAQSRQQAQQFAQQRADASRDVAANASAQRQQLELQNAQHAADLLLTRNTANAQNALQAMGLTQQSAEHARADFLSLLGLQETDLQRMDKAQLENVMALFNAWLQPFSAVAAAGQNSTGSGTGHSSSFQQAMAASMSMGGAGGA